MLKRDLYISSILFCVLLNTNVTYAAAPTPTNGDNAVYTWEADPLSANTSFSVLFSEEPYYLNIKKTSYDDLTAIYPLSYSYEDGSFVVDTHGGSSVTHPRVDGSYTGDFVLNQGDYGGAIYNDDGDITSITGDFISNQALYSGGAIFNRDSTITSITGDFISNKASQEGGAINNHGTITSITGDFISNEASDYGGAIDNRGSISSITGDFISNQALYSGGAIDNVGTILSITGHFISNETSEHGGAIYNDKDSIITSITGDFISNEASEDGGAIYNDRYSTISSIIGYFISNRASSYGGAICNEYDANIRSITGDFISNEATLEGGAIYNYGGTISSITGHFISNEAGNGGAIYNYGDIITSITGDFISNEATDFGGAIYNYGGTITSIAGDFISNKVTGDGGAIYNDWGTISSITGDFISNEAGYYGGVIYNDGGIITSITGDFISNKASYGGAIYNSNSGTITSITGDFISNEASYGGGAIYNEYSTINLIDSSFFNNKADEGGAIYNEWGTMTITAQNKDIVFSNNNKTGTEGGDGYGIYTLGDTFTLNAAQGKSITINDKIYAREMFNINTDETYHGGLVEFNAPFSGDACVYLKDGSLVLGKASPLNVYTLTVGKDASFDIGANAVSINTDLEINGLLKIGITNLLKDSDVYEGGKITASTVTLGDQADLSLTIAPSLLKHQESSGVLTLIDADEITGDFRNVLSNERYEITSVSPGQVIVTGMYSPAEIVEKGNGTQNNVQSAVAWDEASLPEGKASEVQAVLNDLSQHDPKGYVEALTNLAPTDSMVHVDVTQDFNNLIENQVDLRLADQGMNSGDVFNKKGAWIQALYNHTKKDATSKTSGFKGDTAGVAFGIDGELFETVTLGIGYAYGKTDIDSNQRKTDVKSHSIYTYAQYQPSKLYINGLINYGFAKYDEKSNVGGILNKSDYDVYNYGARASLGYNFESGLTPEASLRLTHLKRESYTDDVGQRVSSDDMDILTGKIGLKYTTTLTTKDITFRPTAHIGLIYDILSSNSKALVEISNSSYTITGQKLNRYGLETGLGAQMSINNWDLSAEYSLASRKDYKSHTGLIKARYNF